MADLTATINAVGRTIRDMNIDDIISQETNIVSFALDEILANKPNVNEVVIINRSATKIFAGIITRVHPVRLDGTTFRYECDAGDYTIELDRHKVVESYTNKTIHFIIDDLNTNWLTGLGITITNVENPGPTIKFIQFNYLSVTECLKKLADTVGYDWYIDYDKDIHFFSFETNDAPLELDDTETGFDNLDISEDYSQIRNKIWVRAPFYLSSVYTQATITAGAGQTEFSAKYFPVHSLTVTVNAVPKTVAIEGVEEAGTHDFMLNTKSGLLKVDTIVMAGGELVIMAYKFEIPLLVIVDDPTSIATYGVHEHLIKRPEINNLDWARDDGRVEIRKFKDPITSGSFTSTTHGWRSGQRLHIDLTDRGIDDYYMIRKVNISAIGADSLLYTIEFSTSLVNLTWLMIQLIDRSRLVPEVQSENLQWLEMINETITLSDTVNTTLQTPPHQYGPGGSPQGVYNLSEYS